MSAIDSFTSVTARDLFSLVVGAKLGQGAFREVYASKTNPKVVLKFETDDGNFDNILEHEVWNRVKDTEFAKWFAPVHHISDCGVILVQERTQPLAMSELPARIPAFFTDLKRQNWGRLNGRIVCHDYGRNLLMENGMTKRMRKADWWEGYDYGRNG